MRPWHFNAALHCPWLYVALLYLLWQELFTLPCANTHFHPKFYSSPAQCHSVTKCDSQPSHWLTSMISMQLKPTHTTQCNSRNLLEHNHIPRGSCNASRPDLPILRLGQRSINPIQPPNGPRSLPIYKIPSSWSWFWSQFFSLKRGF